MSRMIVVVGSVQVRRHNTDIVGSVLSVQELTVLQTGDLRQCISLVGLLQFRSQQAALLHRLRCHTGIDTAAAQCNEWVKIIPQFVMHINLSFVQIAKSNVIKDVIENISKYEAGNEHFVFEITESIQMDSNIAIKRVLKEFVDNGFLLAIDDFGTGYSNFEYMKDKMFGILKIDRAFITDIHLTDNNRILVSFIIKMAHEMGVKICVEGVETKDELMAVTKLEADYIQGYYYGKPVKDVEFYRMIKQQERIKR